MSTSVRILRKKVNACFEDIEKIINIFMSMGYTKCDICDCIDTYDLTISIPVKCITSTFSKKSLIIYIDLVENSEAFNYPLDGEKYYSYIFFDNISGSELMCLEFLHKYFELFPNDIFWDCGDFFYTKKDIDIMYKKESPDPNWLYINPDLFYVK